MNKYVITFWTERNDVSTDVEKVVEAESEIQALIDFVNSGTVFRKIQSVELLKPNTDWKSILKSNTIPNEKQRRLYIDKSIINASFETYFADLHLETENKEIKDFIERANFKIAMVKSELLTELNEL